MEGYLQSYTTVFFKETDIFLDDFIKKCKDNANEAQFEPLEVKITYNEWRWNKDYMHKWLCSVKRV